jgi:processive 1,2-diacylglycerol beta-glucosyltransferase
MMMTYLREKEIVSCPTIGVVTDFTVHPFWESTDLDYYVTADSLLDNQMRKKGINIEKILPLGIPIKSKFSKKTDKLQARTILGIEDKTTILIMMGSMGFGNMLEEITEIDNLDIDFQVICVCGKNEKAYKEISSKSWRKNIMPYGFVDNVDVMMDASDCIITKPGGLTTSELLAKGLPAVVMNPIRGQEDRNMEFLVNNGAAIMATETYRVEEALYQLLKNDKRLGMLKEGISYLGKPDSTKNLCEFIINLYNEKEQN